jgi:hypothetical protein
MGAFDDLTETRKGGAFDDLVPAKESAPLSRMDKVLKGVRDPIDGGAQLLTKMLPRSVVDAGDSLNNWIADKTGLMPKLQERNLSSLVLGGKTGVDKLIADQEAEYQARRAADEPMGITEVVSGKRRDPGFDGYRVLGNVVSPANLAIAARAPMAASLAGRMGVGAATGAGSAALNPTMGDDFWQEKLKQVGIGAAFGGATPLLTGALSRIISPKASTNPNLQLLRSEGVQPSVGQSLGGWANRVEEKAMSLPIVGDAISATRERAREQFNKAAINRAVAPIGEKVDEVGQAGIQKAGDLLSKSYDDAISKVKAVKFDSQFATEVGQLRTMAQNMQPAMAQRFNSTIDDVLQPKIVANGSMLGTTYKQIDSKLGQEAAKFGKSSDPFQQELGDAYKQLQALLKEQATRSNPGFAEAIKQADKGWANLVRLEGAGKAALNSEGVFTPGQLNAAVRQADSSVRGRSIGRGTALMQDLGNAGQQVLGNKVPNSGTADRLMLGGAGLGAYFVDPLIPSALLGGAAMYTSPIQGLLRGAVANRPEAAQAVSNSLLQASPRLLPGVAQMGLGLLN